jgi:thermostable 8-oxoguanine DNA glycosylase
MDYKNYRIRGLQIGSEAIETAHRNIIQKRMRQSGQRWYRKRAQYMLNLRTCYMSGKWKNVIRIIRKNAA